MTLTLDTTGFQVTAAPNPGTGLRSILTALAARKALIASLALHGVIAGTLLYSHTNIAATPDPVGAVDMVFETAPSGRFATQTPELIRRSPGQTSLARQSTPVPTTATPPPMATAVASAKRSVTRATSTLPDIAPLPIAAQGIQQANRAVERSFSAAPSPAAAPERLATLNVRPVTRPATVPPARPAPVARSVPTPAKTLSPVSSNTAATSNRVTPPVSAANTTAGELRGTAASGKPTGQAAAAAQAPGFRRGSAANPSPKYPRLARQRGQQGRVILRVSVKADGKVADIAVHHSSGFRLLDRAALKTVQGWSFTPARQHGKPVAGRVDVPVAFRLHD